jgi:hypothetical protein
VPAKIILVILAPVMLDQLIIIGKKERKGTIFFFDTNSHMGEDTKITGKDGESDWKTTLEFDTVLSFLTRGVMKEAEP